MRRRQALIARRRALVAAARNGLARTSLTKASDNHAVLPATLAFPEGFYREGNITMPLPNGWSAGSSGNGTSNFLIAPPSGMPEAHATLAVVAVASTGPNNTFGRQQRNMLGGVSYTDLRRNVIDKMISAGGWVVNDRQRDIAGQPVFEVIAQTPGTNGKPEQVWNFYFTQVNGRIYSLTTHTAGGSNGRLACDAERFLATFHPMEANKTR